MSESPPTSGPGVSRRTSRYGPGLSLLGLALWLATVAGYLLLRPPGLTPGDSMSRAEALRLVLTVVLAAAGVFAASITSALGLFLSLSERRRQPGGAGVRGTILGAIGVAALGLVVAEILRLAFAGD